MARTVTAGPKPKAAVREHAVRALGFSLWISRTASRPHSSVRGPWEFTNPDGASLQSHTLSIGKGVLEAHGSNAPPAKPQDVGGGLGCSATLPVLTLGATAEAFGPGHTSSF